MKPFFAAVLLAASILAAPITSAYGQAETVAELAARGWRASALASSPDFPLVTSTLSEQEYNTFLYDLVSLAYDQDNLLATLRALRRQGVPATQTCSIMRAIFSDRGRGRGFGNPFVASTLREAGCQGL